MYCHSCAPVGLFLNAYTLCIMQWLSVEHTSILPWLVNFYVLVFIPSVNEHYDHYLVVFTWLIKPWFVSLLHLCLITYCLFHMHFTIFYLTMINVYCCVSGVLCLYDSSASQLLYTITTLDGIWSLPLFKLNWIKFRESWKRMNSLFHDKKGEC